VYHDRLDQLLPKVRAGDEAAYRQFLAKAAERLRADLHRMVAGEEVLEKIVRDCLLAVHRRRHTLDPGRPVGPWLTAIALYRLAQYRRRHPDPAVASDLARYKAAPSMLMTPSAKHARAGWRKLVRLGSAR
jgi:RNA polymerase sigma-70 factor, ECF subfamily